MKKNNKWFRCMICNQKMDGSPTYVYINKYLDIGICKTCSKFIKKNKLSAKELFNFIHKRVRCEL